MTIKAVDVRDAQSNFEQLLNDVRQGTEVLLTEGETPLARLVPMAASAASRVAGLHLGAIWTSDDFDQPLPDDLWTVHG